MGLKRSFDDVTTIVDEFCDQRHPSADIRSVWAARETILKKSLIW